jgi:hypothetical protein
LVVGIDACKREPLILNLTCFYPKAGLEYTVIGQVVVLDMDSMELGV